jgi:3'-phosphoadenosine 5'-phosphosulfate sulfotransferase (PAPS reductase)/FAD synthetase
VTTVALVINVTIVTLVTKFTSILTVTHVTTGTMVIIVTINVLNITVIFVTKLIKFPMVAFVREVTNIPKLTVVILLPDLHFQQTYWCPYCAKAPGGFRFADVCNFNTDFRTLKISVFNYWIHHVPIQILMYLNFL